MHHLKVSETASLGDSLGLPKDPAVASSSKPDEASNPGASVGRPVICLVNCSDEEEAPTTRGTKRPAATAAPIVICISDSDDEETLPASGRMSAAGSRPVVPERVPVAPGKASDPQWLKDAHEALSELLDHIVAHQRSLCSKIVSEQGLVDVMSWQTECVHAVGWTGGHIWNIMVLVCISLAALNYVASAHSVADFNFLSQGNFESTYSKVQRSNAGAWRDWIESILRRDLASIRATAEGIKHSNGAVAVHAEEEVTAPPGKPGAWLLEASVKIKATRQPEEDCEEMGQES